MQRNDDGLVLSPTDLTKHLGCAHITTLDLLALDGNVTPAATDDALQLIFDLGIAHEDAYLTYLRDKGLSITTIEGATNDVSRAQREVETLAAMRTGVDVVYQATFYNGSWGGQADFLMRVETPSDLGSWSYEIQDTKLSRHLKVPALLQMATYAERLAVLQGIAPDKLYVVTGDGDEKPWRLIDVAAFARLARARLRQAVDTQPVTQPIPVAQCGQCRWIEHCDRQWREQDDLSLVAFMRGDHREALRAHGIATLTQLGRSAADDLPREIGRASRERLTHQARLQLWEREHGQPRYDLLLPEPGRGLLRLPAPDQGDLYLDFEGDPYAEDGRGREYLAGLADIEREFVPLWAHSNDQERRLTTDLVDRLMARWSAFPGMHIYHYAPYETSALKRLVMDRHHVREEQLDQLLRGERFVDLYAVVRQGLRISKGSYSIKKLEAFYWGHIRNHNPDVADAMSSVLAYERWMAKPDEQILAQIQAYNRDDVLSTLDLHRWLEQRRAELDTAHGAQPRPHEVTLDPGQPPSERVVTELALAGELLKAGHATLAGLVQWHRREAKPGWWDVYRLADLDTEELIEDPTALGGLSAPEHVRDVKRSQVWRYAFPPQDCKLEVGKDALCVQTQVGAGEIVDLDPVKGWIELKRGIANAPLPVTGLGPPGPLNTDVLADAITDVAREVLAGGTPTGQALLDRRTPLTVLLPGESPRQAVVRIGTGLQGEVLAVQGPPGTGKTTVGAELIRALLDRGLKVGVTANSHAVIGNLLTAVGRPALQRCGPTDHCGAPGVTASSSNPAAAQALADGAAFLVGGTAWAWSSAALRDSVDVLVIDEAGQFSLANAVAVSTAARSLVLLGDPQQLPQPTRALHPDGAGMSALDHLLDGHATVPPDRGVFLGTTWRMHPALAAYVSDLSYEGRLSAGPGQELQAVQAQGLSGSGLRVREVVHRGNSAASPQEADEVGRLWQRLVAGTFTDRQGVTRPVTARDVLVVAPYNNQVGLLRQVLPDGARVGTVDKFQGQEAPVVIYSMTSSSVDDAPRGVSFLYDINRLNVAVSRAQAMAIIVLSPRLLEASVSSPEQLRQVNALCRLAEVARG